eukprot:COSAG05_NODE_21911_length_268_cov_0.615385_1_plen_79_part_01
MAANTTLPAPIASVGTSQPACDIFGTFVDRNFPWALGAGSVVLFSVTLVVCRAHSNNCIPGRVLRCILWTFLLLDALIG